MQDRFEFPGFVSYESLPEYYRRMSIFVAPVWKESFGQVSSFAMAMGIPVCGYDVGGLREILGDSSMLAPPGDVSGLADIAIRLLESKSDRAAKGASQRQRAHQLFSLQGMVNAYRDVYANVSAASIFIPAD